MKKRIITVVSILALVSASFAFMMPTGKKVEKKIDKVKSSDTGTLGGVEIDPK